MVHSIRQRHAMPIRRFSTMVTPSQPDPRPEEETVRFVIEDQVAWVYFNRPDKRN